MKGFAEILWDRSDFIGNQFPQEVCAQILRSMEILSSVSPAGVLTEITPSEFAVLCRASDQLKRRGRAATVADIAGQVNVSVPAVSRTLRSLQQKQLIERSIDDADRRNIRVTLTAAGQDMLEENMKRVVAKLNDIMSVFSQDEMRTIARLYSKFADSMASKLGM